MSIQPAACRKSRRKHDNQSQRGSHRIFSRPHWGSNTFHEWVKFETQPLENKLSLKAPEKRACVDNMFMFNMFNMFMFNMFNMFMFNMSLLSMYFRRHSSHKNVTPVCDQSEPSTHHDPSPSRPSWELEKYWNKLNKAEQPRSAASSHSWTPKSTASFGYGCWGCLQLTRTNHPFFEYS